MLSSVYALSLALMWSASEAIESRVHSHQSVVRRNADLTARGHHQATTEVQRPSRSASSANGTFPSLLSSEHLFDKDDDPVKIIFYAGVEGSGHHVLKAFFEKIPYCPLAYAPPSWNCGAQWDKAELPMFVNQLKELVVRQRSLQSSVDKQCVHVLYDLSRPEVMQSYPCDGLRQARKIPNDPDTGDSKLAHQIRTTYAYPRLDWIQEAVQQVPGTQLHVIHLHRGMSDCLAADCKHREFESCDMETETLAVNGAILLEHLRKIPPHQRSCFMYGRRESMEMAIKESFGSKFGEVVDQVFQEDQVSRDVQSSPEWAGFMSKLQGVEGPLLELCKETQSGSS
jgi:hypothetical protein